MLKLVKIGYHIGKRQVTEVGQSIDFGQGRLSEEVLVDGRGYNNTSFDWTAHLYYGYRAKQQSDELNI